MRYVYEKEENKRYNYETGEIYQSTVHHYIRDTDMDEVVCVLVSFKGEEGPESMAKKILGALNAIPPGDHNR